MHNESSRKVLFRSTRSLANRDLQVLRVKTGNPVDLRRILATVSRRSHRASIFARSRFKGAVLMLLLIIKRREQEI